MHHPQHQEDLHEVVDLDRVAAWTARRAHDRELAAARPGRWEQLRARRRRARNATRVRRVAADSLASGPRLLKRLLGLSRPAGTEAWTARQPPATDGQTIGTYGRSPT